MDDDAVVLQVEREVADSIPARALLRYNLRQVVHTLVPLSPNSRSCYRCKNREGNDMLWKRCGLLSTCCLRA